MQGTTSKRLPISEIIDELRAEFAAGAAWPADRLYQLWKQAKPKDTPQPEWYDPDDREEIDIEIEELKALLREALAAEVIRARARGESTVVIERKRNLHDG